MTQLTVPQDPVRLVRLLHASLVIGCVLLGAVFLLVIAVPAPPAQNGTTAAAAFAGIGLVLLAVGRLVLRPRVPARSMQVSREAYWTDGETRTRALVLWALMEGASLLNWVGYYMTAAMAPAVVAVLAIVVLVWHRPATLERAA